MYDLLYEEDILEYKQSIEAFARKMDVFGETEDFLKKLKLPDLEALEKMSPQDFMVEMFKMVTFEIGPKTLKKMIKGTKIISIDETEFLTIVKYEIPYEVYGEWKRLQSEMEMIYSGGRWQLFFRGGLKAGLQRFQREIDQYHERKAKDRPEKVQHEGDLSVYTLKGYKNLDGEIVFEARFREASEFSQGLACVKIMRKYGYINLKGELAIKPQFLEARDFVQGRAAVCIAEEKEGRKWGFINRKGQWAIPPIYNRVYSFSEGLSAVKKGDKWGYIDKKGEIKLPFKFDSAGPFEFGEANVEVKNSKGKWVQMIIDKKGRLVD